MTTFLASIPDALKHRNQWCLAGRDKSPQLVDAHGRAYDASSTRGPWMSFEAASAIAQQNGMMIGYVLTKDDPFVCFDFDVKDSQSVDSKGFHYPQSKWTPREALDWYAQVVNANASYCEVSASGKGLHLWVEGWLEKGVQPQQFGVYPHSRFIVCTGWAVSDVRYEVDSQGVVKLYANGFGVNAIRPAPELIAHIAAYDTRREVAKVELPEFDHTLSDEGLSEFQTLSDDEIWRRASIAENADKFIDLCNGKWETYGYPSQSEADLALMSIFTYFSADDEQCRRMFRETELGKRRKAMRDNVYLNRTLYLVRRRQSLEANVEGHGAEVAKMLVAKVQEKEKLNGHNYLQESHQTTAPQTSPAFVPTMQFDAFDKSVIDWPPGWAGEIARFICGSAKRPVKEIGIISALGLLAGLTGLAYNISGTGLNGYFVLLGRSGIGKEALHTGIGHILAAKCGQTLKPFVDTTVYVSGPALKKAVSKTRCSLNLISEYGKTFQQMAEKNRSAAASSLRSVMTELYSKSSYGTIGIGMAYSNSDRNSRLEGAVAYSMLGESTPDVFYDAITSEMFEDGFFSRKLILEAESDRGPVNPNPLTRLPEPLDQLLGQISIRVMGQLGDFAAGPIDVELLPDAKDLFDSFELFCDSKIVGEDDEGVRQAWNRAHLKALKIAGTLAVADNHICPVVNYSHADWAIDIVYKTNANLLVRKDRGDFDRGDNACMKKLKCVLQEYIKGGGASEGYHQDVQMEREGVVKRSYINRRLRRHKCFTEHRCGTNFAINASINEAMLQGILQKIPDHLTVSKYSFKGDCYRVLNLEL